MECQFTALEACPGSKTRLDRLLASLPRTLDKTYERMLSNIEEESADDAGRMLLILCTAKRPLTVDELIDGIAVELGDDPKFNEDSRLMGEEDIRHICPGFIEMDMLPGGKTIVRIAHYSVQEYLESDRIRQSGVARFGVERADANTQVACTCLIYLMDVLRPYTFPDFDNEISPKYPFAEYAATHWPGHYHDGKGTEAHLHQLTVQLVHDRLGALVSWIFNPGPYFPVDIEPNYPSPLVFASIFGLDRVVQVLLSECGSTGRSDVDENALLAAAAKGHPTTIQLLLDGGADIGYQDPEGTALHYASRSHCSKAVEVLLDWGADIDALNSYSMTPIHYAISMDHEQAFLLLLERGANIEVQDSQSKTPLHYAVSQGRERAVRLLLERGANIRAQDSQGRTPLHFAVLMDNVQATQLLLERGANIEVQDSQGRTSLQYAESSKHGQTLPLLLKGGTKIGVQNP